MLYFLPNWLKGVIATLLISLNTIIAFPFILIASLTKLIVPVRSVGLVCTNVAIWFAGKWVFMNGAFLRLLHKTKWQVTGVENLRTDDWYFVTCNHQSWADIPILQNILHGHTPFIKFFLKKELIWVPVLGIAWWALDFPFMQRFSREYLEKHPEMRGKDFETTRIACEKFKYSPISVFNFLEGTRYTAAKHKQQNSPYKYLLKPKAGGAAFVVGAMGEELRTMLDVTILYPHGNGSFWGLLSGELDEIIVDVQQVPIPEEFAGRNYMEDQAFREAFQAWVTEIWDRKDQKLTEMHQQYTC